MTGGAGQLPPREFYEAVKAVSKAAAGLEEHHREVVAKGMEDTPTLRTIASETKKSLLHRVDAWTVRVLEDAMRLLILYAEKQMSLRSSKSDYCPKEETAAIEATRTVKAVSSVLEEQHSVFVDCLKEVDQRVDLRMLWESVGLRVHELFVEHLKKTKVNVIGAFILANDVNRLQEVLGRFGCEGVTSAAEELREIANLYVVPPENLLSLMEQGRLMGAGGVRADASGLSHGRRFEVSVGEGVVPARRSRGQLRPSARREGLTRLTRGLLCSSSKAKPSLRCVKFGKGGGSSAP
ncbi:conserved unknown protein [Ectocarpus siliculosus]|uniref:Exocyst complex component Sec10-like alpha-helical bundle domain-containing protein n=1 Tax=Ectocarpus siliculosus TaxID=2880 RepID=D7G516_ECTSI|nr:conserved unknown protein [Ectocarpus siliculosus]|eukprot:CBJ33779.1 conserved unknown protein [Ectocarpus siliculosus]